MLGLLWLIPALPAAGFVTLTLLNGRLSRRAVSFIGAGSVGLAFIVAALVTVDFVTTPPAGDAYRQVLWTWFDVAGLRPQIALYLDAVSLLFVLVITFVGFLIHLYSTEFMEDEEGFARFFIYMNLFVASMLVLVLADNLLFLYMGWEGVGLCSYLLIGFWYRDPQNGYAARKAFIVTRIGDTAMIVGLFLLFAQLGTLQIQPLMQRVQAEWAPGSSLAVAAALLLLGGAVGKSAQLPLQTWLPDAMAGPTPVSALIHAATMVTAGVYLIARTHVLFTMAPDVRLTVAIIGTVTLLYAGFSALAQTDFKRVLAYSTISQIGYMFLALGVAGWSAGVFHFMTHAFFKALLFLAAGVVIEALGGEHDIFRMGGLRRRLPVAFWASLIGAASLAALPLITAGFYSKDLIVEQSLAAVDGDTWLWLGAIVCSVPDRPVRLPPRLRRLLRAGAHAGRAAAALAHEAAACRAQRAGAGRRPPPRAGLARRLGAAGRLPADRAAAHGDAGGHVAHRLVHDGAHPGARAARCPGRLVAVREPSRQGDGAVRGGALLAGRLGLRRDLRVPVRAAREVVRPGGPGRPGRARRRGHRRRQRRRLARAERVAERRAALLRRRRRRGRRRHHRLRGAQVRRAT